VTGVLDGVKVGAAVGTEVSVALGGTGVALGTSVSVDVAVGKEGINVTPGVGRTRVGMMILGTHNNWPE
jgi:hypothetical protein